MSRSPSRRSAFTLAELVVALAVLFLGVIAVAVALHSGVRSSQESQARQAILSRARAFLDRLLAQSFGEASDADPTAAQLDELFDGDEAGGDVTLCQLNRWPREDGGWRFTLADSPARGEWRARVDNDLDGDGRVGGALEESRRIWRVQVFYGGELLLESMKAQGPELGP
jgi:Tfp pilus assembly protein PilV